MANFRSILLLAAFSIAAGAQADITSLVDNFDSESLSLNYTGFANWDVTDGSVDLIGAGFFDVIPGNGNYVDLDGTSSNPGILATKEAFAPGTYSLSFENGGNDNLGALLDNVSVQAVPEPMSLATLALGGVALLRRRRSK